MKEFKGRIVAPGTVTAQALVSQVGLNTLASFQGALQFGDKFFLMKDGDARIVIAVPDGQITEVGEVTFASNAAVGWNVTLSCSLSV